MENKEYDRAIPGSTPILSPIGAGFAPSGVSWAAIIAGAAAAAALSLILVMLGFGLGFSAVSPWPSSGASATAITISTAIWLALTQIVASGFGGYLAGRLRVKWTDVQADEIYFRDTAHGLLSWAVATLVTAAFLGSAITAVAGAGAQMTATVASSVVPAATNAASSATDEGGGGVMAYFVNGLFRSDKPSGEADISQIKGEATTILTHSLTTGALSEADKTRLAHLVAQQTGLNPADAEKRIDDLYGQARQFMEQTKTKAKEAVDTARKAAAATALWAFVALLCGAFFASLAAIWGGHRRDLSVLEATLDPVRR